MNEKIFPVIIIITTIVFISCGSIQNYRNLDQPSNQPLITSIGGTVFRLNRFSDLPNVFGNADLWGGKIDRGYVELKFLGFTEKGEIIFSIIDINKSSSETTMDRYKNQPTIQVQTNVDILSSSPQEGTKFIFDPSRQKDIVIAGIQVIFTDIKPYSISYFIKDTQPN